MKSTYLKSDVNLLCTDIETRIIPMSIHKREKLIRLGTNPCELLARERTPTYSDEKIYNWAMAIYKKKIADAVREVSEQIYIRKGKEVVLVSLARAGISIGVLIKRYLEQRYNLNIPHYSMSIVGTNGMDINALKYILKKHSPDLIQFVDGWTGKGYIQKKLKENLLDYPQIDSDIAVLYDPGYITDIAGTHEDILVPSATLNATVSGLLSRAVDNKDIMKKDEYFGAVFFSNLMKMDKTYDFINGISREFNFFGCNYDCRRKRKWYNVNSIIESIINTYGIADVRQIKPGLCETFRSINRKKPDFVLINPFLDKELLLLLNCLDINTVASEKLGNYMICGVYTDVYSDV